MSENQHRTSESFVVCEIAGTSYGVRSTSVKQLEMVENVTRVPNAAPAVEGVVFSRGEVIPALNLRVRFGFERIPYDLQTRLVVADVEGRTVGLIVDAAREFISIPEDSIEPPPDAVVGLSGKYLAGIASLGDRVVLVLDLAEVARISEVVAEGEGDAL